MLWLVTTPGLAFAQVPADSATAAERPEAEPSESDPEPTSAPAPARTPAAPAPEVTAALAAASRSDTPAVPEPLTRVDLQLETVFESVRAHHPSVASAAARYQSAVARELAADGSFDPRARANAQLITGDGYYDLLRAELSVDQATPFGGLTLSARYRYGRGLDGDARFPSYYSNETLDAGELSIAAKLPLLRGLVIDERRAAVARAEASRRSADAGRSRVELALEMKAAKAYYAWVAAGAARELRRELLALVVQRDGQIRARVAAGAAPAIHALENRQQILARRASLISAERSHRVAALELSLYLRDDRGAPRLVEGVTPLRIANAAELGELSIECHPELRVAEADIEAGAVRAELADNATLPRLDLQARLSRDLGEGDVQLQGNNIEVGLSFEFPLLNRSARGRSDALEAELIAKRESLRLLRDQLTQGLLAAQTRATLAMEQAALMRESAELAAQLRDAEQSSFEAGASSLLDLNIRERRLAAARLQAIDAEVKAEASIAAARLLGGNRC